jgi:hypothetical protein
VGTGHRSAARGNYGGLRVKRYPAMSPTGHRGWFQ